MGRHAAHRCRGGGAGRAAAISDLADDLDAEVQARIAADSDEEQARQAAEAGIVALDDEISSPIATTSTPEGRVTRVDASGNAIEIMRSDGLDAIMSDQFWERGRDGVGISDIEDVLATPIETQPTIEGRVTRVDAIGNAIEIMRNDGLDMHMSSQFWERGAEILGASANDLSDTEIDIISVNGQSLTVVGDWTALVPQTAALERVGNAALQLSGMYRADGVALNGCIGPLSAGYDETVPATGLEPAYPYGGRMGLPFAMATTLDDHRTDAGVPRRRC